MQRKKANRAEGPLKIEETILSRNNTPPQVVKLGPESPTENKLRPLPRNAPRDIQTKGKYTIRKGVRIRDYRVPRSSTKIYVSPSNSPEFQCRDGFDASETSFTRPSPTTARTCSKNNSEWHTISLYQVPLSPHNDACRRTTSLSPSLGTGDHEDQVLVGVK